MINIRKIHPKKLLLASSIALTMSASVSFASLDKKIEQDWIKENHPELLNQEVVSYYVRYSEKSMKSQLKNNLK